jgi:hypothetical protein
MTTTTVFTTANKTEKINVIAYWITTGLLALGMFSGGLAQAIHAQWNVDGFIHLGFPIYTMTILGTWKILGVIALLVPGFRLLKEWAYAGFFFLMTGAVIAHLASGDGIAGIVWQSFFVILIVLSWALRPASRRLLAN